jgi:hypothetical protein
MADLKGRLTVLEKRRRDEQREFRTSTEGSELGPEQAAAAYRQIMIPVWVPTAEEVRKSEQWNLLTATEASNLYSRLVSEPRFDIDRAVAKMVAGREMAQSGNLPGASS